ncbi:hypothetical protein FACS1894120_4940 [Clostridia bacterium]|nr:hypothetical protein FACS1894120_4940 [Clostridia bacterium]
MEYREEKIGNDLFFVCSLIETIGRITHNKRIDIIKKIGEKNLTHILELADIYHCEPIKNTAEDLIEKHGIESGNFDNVSQCKYSVPTAFDIGKVYKRLVIHAMEKRGFSPIKAVFSVYNSFVTFKIDNYNSSVYYESPAYLAEFYDKDTEPEKYDFYLANYLEELKKAFLAMPDYVRRETDGYFTPLNFFKITLRDTVNCPIEITKSIVHIINEIKQSDIPLNEVDADLSVDEGSSQAFFLKFA